VVAFVFHLPLAQLLRRVHPLPVLLIVYFCMVREAKQDEVFERISFLN